MSMRVPFGSHGPVLMQTSEVISAFVLSAVTGLERELHHKSAGIRTYTIVGTTASLFLIIPEYGFADVLSPCLVVRDPSCVAAQIVTGIGFSGAGLIFVNRERVVGLTTAATVWLVTSVAGRAIPGAGDRRLDTRNSRLRCRPGLLLPGR